MSNSTIVDGFKDFALDAGYSLLDSLLTPNGIVVTLGTAALLAGTAMIAPYFAAGEKDWLTAHQAWKMGLYGDPKKGIILGRYKGQLVSYEGSYHIGVDGTTGTGKTACTFLATLLSNEHYSFIVLDQSCSLYQLTSGRRSQFGPVYRIDPTKVNSDCYNPFDDIPDDNRIVSNLDALYATLLAGTSADQKKTGGDSFFDKKPREVLPFVTMQVLYGQDASKKNIAGVLEFMADGKTCFQEMVNNPRHPQCEQVGRDMLGASDATRSSIITTIKASLAIWRDDNVARITSSSSFRMEDLATSAKGPITIYLTAPTTMLQRMMPFYVMMEELLKLHLMNTEDKTLSGKPKVRPVCIADDEAQNSKRPNIDTLEVARKFKVWYLFGYQSINAMIDLYSEPKMDLIKLKVTYRPTVGGKVIDRLVKMSGTYKKKTLSHSESHGRGNGNSRSRNWSIKDTPRLTEHEWENLPEYGKALLTHPKKPALLETFDSKVDPEFKKLILPEFAPTSKTRVFPVWNNVTKPVVRSGLPVPQEMDEDDGGIQQEEHNQTGAMLMMVNGFENEEEVEEEIQPPPQIETRNKRRVSF